LLQPADANLFSQLSRLEYIHSHNYIHGDIKPQNVLIGVGNLSQTVFLIDFGITKEFWSTATGAHIPFRRGRRLTGTPAFASINSHLGLELGRRDDIESLAYMLVYFLRGFLPWLTDDHEKLSNSSLLERKANASIECLCYEVPSEIATMVVYSRSLAFSEEPDYHYIRSLLHKLRATLPVSAAPLLDFSQPDDTIVHSSPCSNDPPVTESVTPHRLEAISRPDDAIIRPPPCSNDRSMANPAASCCTKTPLRRSARHA
jgi:serine/threonine protein kinase